MTPRVGDVVDLITRDGPVRMRVIAVVTLSGCEHLVARTLDDSWGVFMRASAFTIPEHEGGDSWGSGGGRS